MPGRKPKRRPALTYAKGASLSTIKRQFAKWRREQAIPDRCDNPKCQSSPRPSFGTPSRFILSWITLTASVRTILPRICAISVPTVIRSCRHMGARTRVGFRCPRAVLASGVRMANGTTRSLRIPVSTECWVKTLIYHPEETPRVRPNKRLKLAARVD